VERGTDTHTCQYHSIFVAIWCNLIVAPGVHQHHMAAGTKGGAGTVHASQSLVHVLRHISDKYSDGMLL
jgi:hypothetical protein